MKLKEKQLTKAIKNFCLPIIGSSSSKKCYMVCAPLCRWLCLLGVEVELVEGEVQQPDGLWVHWWLELPDGRIIDPTADQFRSPAGDPAERIYFGARPDWYRPVIPQTPQPERYAYYSKK